MYKYITLNILNNGQLTDCMLKSPSVCLVWTDSQARKRQPSIIFFDEIDGLAPVRSARNDHIHNSIVTTLLALMDGFNTSGNVVVIGATNRIDSIDPALRRPGRFDLELAFPLPNLVVSN